MTVGDLSDILSFGSKDHPMVLLRNKALGRNTRLLSDTSITVEDRVKGHCTSEQNTASVNHSLELTSKSHLLICS